MSAVITYGDYKACVGSGDVLGVSDPRLAAVSYFRPSSYSFSSFMYQVAQNNVCLFPSQRSGRASGVESAPRPSPRPTTGKTPSPWRLHLSWGRRASTTMPACGSIWTTTSWTTCLLVLLARTRFNVSRVLCWVTGAPWSMPSGLLASSGASLEGITAEKIVLGFTSCISLFFLIGLLLFSELVLPITGLLMCQWLLLIGQTIWKSCQNRRQFVLPFVKLFPLLHSS